MVARLSIVELPFMSLLSNAITGHNSSGALTRRDRVVFRRNREKIREGAIRGGTLANVVVPILTQHPPVVRPK